MEALSRRTEDIIKLTQMSGEVYGAACQTLRTRICSLFLLTFLAGLMEESTGENSAGFGGIKSKHFPLRFYG
jgi:hypothetical protein